MLKYEDLLKIYWLPETDEYCKSYQFDYRIDEASKLVEKERKKEAMVSLLWCIVTHSIY